MKKILMFILLLPICFSMYGGESEVIKHFDNCTNVLISVEGNLTIDPGEYVFKDCIEIGVNYWSCECNGSFDLIMETKSNTLNDYNISINYTYEVDEADPYVPYSGGGGGSTSSRGLFIFKCVAEWNCTEWSECINSFERRTCVDINNCSDIITPEVSNKCGMNNTAPVFVPNIVEELIVEELIVEEPIVEEPIVEEQDKSNVKVIIIIISAICIIGIIIGILLYLYLKE